MEHTFIAVIIVDGHRYEKEYRESLGAAQEDLVELCEDNDEYDDAFIEEYDEDGEKFSEW